MGVFGRKKEDDLQAKREDEAQGASRPATAENESTDETTRKKGLASMFSGIMGKKVSATQDAEPPQRFKPDDRSEDFSEHGGLSLPSARAPNRTDSFDSLPGVVAQEGVYNSSSAAGPVSRSFPDREEARPVRQASRLVNNEYEDSDSSDDFDGGVISRIVELRKKEVEHVEEGEKKTVVNMVRFERRKRQIADRFQTRRDLIEDMTQEGPNIGGQWIDQKWVSNKTLNVKKDQFTVKKWAKDLLSYLLFLFAFTFLIFTSSGDSEFVSFQRVWRRLLAPRMGQIISPSSSLDAIERLILEDIMLKKRPYVSGFSPPGGPGVDLLYGSILVGKFRMRQLRVKGQPCSRVHQMLLNYGMLMEDPAGNPAECYPAYQKTLEEISYKKANDNQLPVYDDDNFPFFDYKSPFETNFGTTTGAHGVYDAGGYVVTFGFDDANKTLSVLRNFQWIDKKTRALFFDFTFYSDDVGLFMSNNVLIEFSSGQAPAVTVDSFAISPMRFRTGGSNDLLRLGATIVVYVMVIYYVIEELDLCRATGIDRYKSVSWAYLDLVNISLFLVSGCLQAYNIIAYEIAIPGQIEDDAMLARIKALGRTQYLEEKMQGLNGFFLWFKLFKYVTITRSLMHMGRVLGTCIPDILSYGFLFCVVLIAFAVLGYLFCGNELQSFSTIELSTWTILRSMYGDFDFDGLVEVSGVTGFVYLSLWIVTSNILLLNMFIAILSESYRKVGEEERHEPSDTTYSKIVDEYNRRRKESEDLRAMAISMYGKKKLEEEMKRKPKGRLHRLYYWVRFKVSGKKEEESDEEEQDDEKEEEDDGHEPGASAKKKKQQLAALDWTPWPTRIEPVDPKKKERGPSRIPSSDAMQIKPKPFEPDGLAFSRTPSAKKESRTQTPEKHDTSHTQDHHLVTPPPPARAPSDPLQLQAKKPPADN